MYVETHMQSVKIEGIPNAENITSIAVNLQDMTVEVLYKGYEHRPYTPLPDLITVEQVEQTEEGPRYTGELDDPAHPVERYVPPTRAVRDSPQA